MPSPTEPARTVPADSTESPASVGVAGLPGAPDVDLESGTVDLDRVAAHPGNPRRVLGALADLIPSIHSQGVLQPPVVLPAARVAAAWPEHADQLGDVEWVVLMGLLRQRRPAAQGRQPQRGRGTAHR